MTKTVALLSLVFSLGLINWSIYTKEAQLAEGRVIYLELAPVDPRSLMQGDYMALRFKTALDVRNALPKLEEDKGWQHRVDAKDGFVVVSLDDNLIASYQGLFYGQVLQKKELRLRYRIRDGEVKFATNAFFFQEGHAEIYEKARFGQFRVDDHGELLLAGMYDEQLKLLEAVSHPE